MADPRRTLARPDLAADWLTGDVEATRFAAPEPYSVTAPVLNLRASPDAAGLATQLLHGETFNVLAKKDGLAWGQSDSDGYVGYVAADGLGPVVAVNATVTALAAPVYPAANFKTVPERLLPWQSQVAISGEGAFRATDTGHLCAQHLADMPGDWVDQAARLMGVPYLWGGRSSFGLDCSALVQLALRSVGRDAPRDSDMQEAELGTVLGSAEDLRRGDLVFWTGHVGIMEDRGLLLHANVHHMCVAREPFAAAMARIEANGGGQVTARKRLS